MRLPRPAALRDSHGKYLGSASAARSGTRRDHAFAADARRRAATAHRRIVGRISAPCRTIAIVELIAHEPIASRIERAVDAFDTAPDASRGARIERSARSSLLTKRVAEIDRDFAIDLRGRIQSNLCVPPQDSVEISTGIASPWGLPRNLQRNDMTMSASKVASRSGSVTGEHAVV